MRRRSVVAAAIVAVSLATAIAAAAAGPVPSVLEGPPGIAVAGGAHVTAGPGAHGTTLVRLVRDRDGSVLRSRSLPGRLGVPQVTYSGDAEGTWANGRRLVLASSIYDTAATTTFVALDTRALAPLRTVRLRGSYAFDALSPDGRRLYVTYLPNGFNGPIRYVVRSLRLRTGKLEPGVVVDKAEPDERMAGLPMARAWSLDRGTAYTLYNGLDSHAFVHALDTRHRSARCIDLPWRGAEQNGLEKIRMSVSGRTLLLSMPGVGVLARIDTQSLEVDVLRDPA